MIKFKKQDLGFSSPAHFDISSALFSGHLHSKPNALILSILVQLCGKGTQELQSLNFIPVHKERGLELCMKICI
jgi:hypothetical protein